MVRVREGIFKNYDFCNWTILEMIQFYGQTLQNQKITLTINTIDGGLILKKN